MMLALASTLLVILQDVAPPPEADIEKAIRQGTQYLLNRVKGGLPGDIAVNGGMGYDYNALMLYTLVHSGIGLHNEIVQRLLAAVLGTPFLRTYQVALTAASLAAIDPPKYREKLALCAQYLIDWQCENGQWGYSDRYKPDVPAGMPVTTGTGGETGTVAKFQIRRVKKLGAIVGDNSNSQYAALGLKACATAGCQIDSGTLQKAIDWWQKSQQKIGAWSYNYEGQYQELLGLYGSMTAGAASSLIMLKQMQGLDPKNSEHIRKGINWLADNFTVEKNARTPSGREEWHHYFLYAIERLGDLYPTEKIGKYPWYAIGATYLIKTQQKDGSWLGTKPDLAIADTCFALLFLERVARRPPVATGGTPVPQPK